LKGKNPRGDPTKFQEMLKEETNMNRLVGICVALLLALCAGYLIAPGYSQNLGPAYPDEAPGAKSAADAPKSQITGKSPVDVVASAPKGSLHNPYTDNPEMIAEGRKLFLSYSCNGCHGGNGGGGMCPPLSNDTWVYGSDDDTLFRLVSLGSDKLQKAGYYRIGMENVVGPMPQMGLLIKSDAELWKIIAFIRSVYNGDPKRRNW
jgi:mono/diheme cytochrome c family protein